MEDKELVHSFSKNESGDSFLNKGTIIFFAVLFVLGIGTGYMVLNFRDGSTVTKTGTGSISQSSIKKGQTFGSSDDKTFKDSAEGVLKEGGIDGEGAYHLERPGGESQNVYLTSSIIDLSQFIDKKVKIWGQTNAAKKAGWLMDVGRLQVLE